MSYNDCIGNIAKAALYGTDQAKLLYFINEAVKVYTSECHRKNLLTILGLNTALGPFEMAKAFAEDSISSATANSLLNSAMDQIGERLIYNTAQNAAAGAIDSIMNQSDVKNSIEAAKNVQKALFSVVAIAMTGGNDVILEFAKVIGRKILEYVGEKRELLQLMKDDVRRLNNALMVLQVDNSFQNQWKKEMLEVRNKINDARTKFIDVWATLKANRGFKYRRYTFGKQDLKDADEILTPKKVDGELSGKLDNQGIIWNGAIEKTTGVSVNEEQKAAVNSIPEIASTLHQYIDDYAEVTEKINLLISNYISSYSNLTRASGGRLADMQVDNLAGVIESLQDIIDDMDAELTKDHIVSDAGYSLNTYQWLVEVKTVIARLDVMQPEQLEKIDESNLNLDLYNNSISVLTKTDELAVLGGKVVLKCVDSQEEITDLVTQLLALLAQSQRLYINGKVPDGLYDLSVVIDKRISLSLELLGIIESAIKPFTDLDTPLKENIDNITGMMSDMGYDRARDLLVTGEYDKFFNLTDRTVTYAGAAITCLRAGSECAQTVQVKNEIDKLMLILRRYEKNQSLEASRVINGGRKRQLSRLWEEIASCTNVQGKAERLSQEKGCDQDAVQAGSLERSPTTITTAPKGGFDQPDEANVEAQVLDRTSIIDGEIDDLDKILTLPDSNSGLVGMVDRSSELREAERNQGEINKNISDPPNQIDLDQLRINEDLISSLEEHGEKLSAAKAKLTGLGFDPDDIDTVGIVDGRITSAYRNGKLVYEVNDRQEILLNRKVILGGGQ